MGEGQHRQITGGRAGREASRGQHRRIAGGHAGREARRGQHRRIADGCAGREARRGQHRRIAGGRAPEEERMAGGRGAAGRGVGGTIGVAVVRLPLTGCTSDPRGRPGRVAAVTGLTRNTRLGA